MGRVLPAIDGDLGDGHISDHLVENENLPGTHDSKHIHNQEELIIVRIDMIYNEIPGRFTTLGPNR